ncbi:MAG TPA: hypothetical protein PKY07_07625, partial [Aliarcobacter cryaerophilus]|nr:hypothetical protein [Aliarcobacter cryaerophilus]
RSVCWFKASPFNTDETKVSFPRLFFTIFSKRAVLKFEKSLYSFLDISCSKLFVFSFSFKGTSSFILS